MQTKIRGVNQAGTEQDVRVSEYGLTVIMPVEMLWTARGYGRLAMNTAAIASLIVRPSTLSQLTLYNGESGAGKHYVVDRVFAHNLVSIANGQFGIWLCSHPVNMTAPTGNNITVRNSPSGQAAGGSLSVVDTAESVTDDGWFPWGDSQQQVVATVPGAQAGVPVGGRIIVPPRGGLSIQIVANTAAVTCTVGFHWYEVPEGELTVA